MIEVHVPGKIMLAGEWGVLEPGNYCIVLPVPKYVSVQIKPTCAQAKLTCSWTLSLIFNSQDIGLNSIHLVWNGSGLTIQSSISDLCRKRFNLCFTVMQECLQFLHEQGISIKSFELTVVSQISGAEASGSSAAKPGLGSSAAVAVAVCKAILKFHGFDSGAINYIFSNHLDVVFKLACLSHYLAFGKVGSGFDVACSTYEKPVVYSRFDPDWLKSELETNSLSEILFADWPRLEIREIKLPEYMHVLIGFVGYSASTSQMIEKMDKFKQRNFARYQTIIGAINSVVCELISALESCKSLCAPSSCDKLYCRTTSQSHFDTIVKLINQNRDLLVQLGIESGVELETPELKNLVEIAQSYGAAAKLSGAGGGDCGVAVCFDGGVARKIVSRWECEGIKSV